MDARWNYSVVFGIKVFLVDSIRVMVYTEI